MIARLRLACVIVSIVCLYVFMCLLPLYLKNGTIFHHDITHEISVVQYLNTYRFWKNSDSRCPNPGYHLKEPLNSSNFLNNGPIRSVFFQHCSEFQGDLA